MTIQEIRARQALEEIGDKTSSVEIYHQEDVKTIIGDAEFKLVFPKYLLEYNHGEKDIDFLFIGLITNSREKFIERFRNKEGTVIQNSLRGRDEKIKQWDETYFKMMSRAKFVLCPDGDFTWTYRFFEAIIFGAIPIVKNISPLYEGYHFLRHDSSVFHYNVKETEENLSKIKSEMFLKAIDKSG